MTPGQINEIAESSIIAEYNAYGLPPKGPGFRSDVNRRVETLTTAIRILEEAGVVCLNPDTEPPQHVMEAGYRVYGQSLYRNRGHGEEAIAIFQEMLRASQQKEPRT